MATKTRKTKVESFESESVGFSVPKLSAVKDFRPNKITIILVVVLALATLVYFKKHWFVAATVNGAPISALELRGKIDKTYKTQVLDQMVNDKILEQEAKNKGVTITDDQLSAKIKEYEDQYGGASVFDGLLTQQGMTRDDFKQRIRVQLLAEALYKNDASPSAEEIKKFMDENANIPQATDEAAFKKLAEDEVRNQKLSEVFAKKFQELKDKASVKIF